MAKEFEAGIRAGIAIVKFRRDEVNIPRQKVNLLIAVMNFRSSALDVIHTNIWLFCAVVYPVWSKVGQSQLYNVHVKRIDIALKWWVPILPKFFILHSLPRKKMYIFSLKMSMCYEIIICYILIEVKFCKLL